MNQNFNFIIQIRIWTMHDVNSMLFDLNFGTKLKATLMTIKIDKNNNIHESEAQQTK